MLPTAAPARVLSRFDATCIVIGAIIGSGIFFNPSRIASLVDTGNLALLAWALGGFIAMCGALVFAELGRRYNSSGAQYDILRDSYGPLPAFLFVFCNATGTQACAIGIIAVLCTQNLAAAAGFATPQGWQLMGVASLLIALLATANIIGVRWGSRIQNFTVMCKIATLLAITALAAFAAPDNAAAIAAQPHDGKLSPFAGVLAGLVSASFAYGGWQQALWISGEVRDPRRNLPWAIILGVSIVIVVYLLANWAYLHLLGVHGVAETEVLAADAVATVYPTYGRRAVAAAVGISTFGVLNSQLLSGPRLIYGMARDGRFFRVFGRLSPYFGTPVACILLLAIPAIALLFIAGDKRMDYLLTGAVFIDTVFFALTGAALFIVRRKFKAADSAGEPGFRVPLYPLIPILFILGQIAGMIGTFVDEDVRAASYIGVAWILAGFLLYLIKFRRRDPAAPPPAVTASPTPSSSSLPRSPLPPASP